MICHQRPGATMKKYSTFLCRGPFFNVVFREGPIRPLRSHPIKAITKRTTERHELILNQNHLDRIRFIFLPATLPRGRIQEQPRYV